MLNRETMNVDKFRQTYHLCFTQVQNIEERAFENLEVKRISVMIEDRWKRKDLVLYPLILLPFLIAFVSFLMA